MTLRPFFLLSVLFAAIALTACGGGLEIPESPTGTPRAGTPGSAASVQPGATGSAAAPSSDAGAATPAAGGGLAQERYTVVEGDAPTIIAEKLGVPVERRAAWIQEMLAINNVTATTLRIGMELILPPTP
jgi:hypothetical protein